MKSLFYSLIATLASLYAVYELNQLSLTKQAKDSTQTNFAQIQTQAPKPISKPQPQEPKPEKKKTDLAPDLSQLIAGQNFGLDAFKVDLSQISDGLLGQANDVSMTEDTVDVAPVARQRSELVFPEKARKLGINGSVVLSLFINKEGRVEKTKILNASPVGVFEQSALQAVKSWIFSPAQYQGSSVSVWVTQKISFNLK